jgi:ABC-type polysaccharide transport system permease subunit
MIEYTPVMAASISVADFGKFSGLSVSKISGSKSEQLFMVPSAIKSVNTFLIIVFLFIIFNLKIYV